MTDLIWSALVTKWPKPETTKRQVAEWYVGDGRAEKKILYELDRLGVREARLEVDAAPADFRKLDGGLYRDAKLRTPRVLVVFHLAEIGEVQYACDQYETWRQNLHAIGLTLERLRLIDSYGATVAGARQQYRGFKKLGSGGTDASTEPALSPLEAAALVVRHGAPLYDAGMRQAFATVVLDDAEQMRLYVRKAERATHPDNGGTAASFAEVQRAKAILAMHHGAVTGAGQEEAP